ncbi:hypothetical protein EX30DRAFT_370752 [Ascodesmis nigricans]|uniref:Acyltransferase MbtK/IucB-like conserved domain-containing protein n=1 Tax=Ascodesmis nigricans TaxID=341454 RepID=A0A4V3SJ07_9PEZI|nr:hypothetical protein EX30DRAFT_370752 [Ascodesmis nigricans]
MKTYTFFLSDSSQVTITTPGPTPLGPSTFIHSEPSTSQTYSSWHITLASSSPDPPTFNSDLITISSALTADSKPHHDPVFVLYATLLWYFQLPFVPQTLSRGQPLPKWSITLNRGSGLFSTEETLAAAEQAGLVCLFDSPVSNGGLIPVALQRAFWHCTYPFMKLPSPAIFTMTGTTRHPIRPRPQRRLYRRHIPSVNSILSFRLATMADAPLVNRWMNNPRVSAFWNEEGDITQTEKFLRDGLDKRHTFPVIGCWEELIRTDDGGYRESGKEEPFGYFEVYWVKEDVLGQYCDAGHWERGIHVLVGEERFRGEQRVKAWLGGIVHYCFLDDPRTMVVTLEPRVDNEKFIGYLMREGFYKEKEFAFPHKQAALMRLRREAWDGPSA